MLIGLLIFSSCDKSDPYNGACPDGTIRLNNFSIDPYTVYIDGSYMGVMQAQTTTDYTVSRGGHTVTVVLLTGFNGTPNEYEATAIIEGCDVDVFTFP